uniref:Putative secreted protein n=1 Tax=Lutzomyia longipalpis TaxID=7200 RepID=A0A1B0C824_LUTLO
MVPSWPVLLLLTTATMGQKIQLTQRNNHANISDLLDNLLRGYDNSVRPDFGDICQEIRQILQKSPETMTLFIITVASKVFTGRM